MGKIRDFILRDFNVIPPTASPLAAPGLVGAVLLSPRGGDSPGSSQHVQETSFPWENLSPLLVPGPLPRMEPLPGDVSLFCNRQEDDAEWAFGTKYSYAPMEE